MREKCLPSVVAALAYFGPAPVGTTAPTPAVKEVTATEKESRCCSPKKQHSIANPNAKTQHTATVTKSYLTLTK